MEVRPSSERSQSPGDTARDAQTHNERQVQSFRLLPTILAIALMVSLLIAAAAMLVPAFPPSEQRTEAPVTTKQPNSNSQK